MRTSLRPLPPATYLRGRYRQRADRADRPVEPAAVDAHANRSKGDVDTATWLPPYKSFRCTYVARQIAVKGKCDLWVTAAERDAITRVVATCPTMALPRAQFCIDCGEITKQPTESRGPHPTCACPCAAARWRLLQELHCGLCGGAAPIICGQPGFARKLDRDGDRIACE